MICHNLLIESFTFFIFKNIIKIWHNFVTFVDYWSKRIQPLKLDLISFRMFGAFISINNWHLSLKISFYCSACIFCRITNQCYSWLNRLKAGLKQMSKWLSDIFDWLIKEFSFRIKQLQLSCNFSLLIFTQI